jgi:carbamoyltransferase
MSHVLDFKEEVREKVPAVVHENGTARLQTVTKNDNEWYHNFISMWNKKSGVPIVLNTSFNDREPICETPEHALNCFLGTEIDYLYFYEEGILVSRK